MASQRFYTKVVYNLGFDPALFDPAAPFNRKK
jgi:hypothetical protein